MINISFLEFENIMITPSSKEGLQVRLCRNVPLNEKYGNEAFGMPNAMSPSQDTSFQATEYFLSGLTPDDIKALKKGYAYLEFWIEGIDHSKRTANRKLYPQDLFLAALTTEKNMKEMNYGGIPGEAEHPALVSTGNKEVDLYTNMTRLGRKERCNTTHFITGYKSIGTKTYFKIKTSIDNPMIVNDILNGMTPGFSIRTTGNFVPDGIGFTPDMLRFHTIDYVRNPANADSHVKPGEKMHLINTAKPAEIIDLQLMSRKAVGMESEDIIDFVSMIGMESDLMIAEESTGNPVYMVVPKSYKKADFNSEMNHLKLSIL